MGNSETCPICEEQIEFYSIGTQDAFSVTCPSCGQYQVSRTDFEGIVRNTKFSSRESTNISGWLRENPNFEITADNIKRLKSIPTPSFHERADKFLLYLDRMTIYAGHEVSYDISWLAFSWSFLEEELEETINFLVSTERILKHGNYEFVKIKPAGWAHLEKLKKTNPDSQQGFVAMWFDDDMKKICDDVISEAIYDAGYDSHRVDQREHNNKIDDEIIAQIRRSRFVLADFTGHRGGVYYEAGFAMGLGLEVFWTCREDEIEELHFDIRQYNCISWEKENLPEFKKKITNRIEAIIGHGTFIRNSQNNNE